MVLCCVYELTRLNPKSLTFKFEYYGAMLALYDKFWSFVTLCGTMLIFLLHYKSRG